MINKEKIKEEAQSILKKFQKSLEKIELKEKKHEKEQSQFREEGTGLDFDPEFRIALFANAPETDGDFLVSDKKSW